MIKFIRRLFSRKKKHEFEITTTADGFHVYWNNENVEAIVNLKTTYFSFFSHRKKNSGEILNGYHTFTLEGVSQRARWADSLRKSDPRVNWNILFGDMYQISTSFRERPTND
jgi:hypothetical protein